MHLKLKDRSWPVALSARSLSFLVAGLLTVLAVPGTLSAQTLTVEPSCGKAGDSFKIGGSGWAEPIPVCEYIFKFDDSEFAPRQPDGLFGPPNRNVTVPSVPAGDHTVKVELRLTSNGSLLQCRQTKFKVVDTNKDPWDSGNNITTGTGNVSIKFDPQDVCDVTPCNKVVFFQAMRMTGEKADGTTRQITGAEFGHNSATTLDADTTSTGWVIDAISNEKDPYYNGDDSADVGTQGLQNGQPKTATMSDGPNIPDSAFPSDIVKFTLDFEVAAFCGGGQNKGEFLGTATWTWQRAKGAAATATASSGSRNPPSQNLLDALAKFNSRTGFKLPTPSPPTSGGTPCS